MSPLYARLLCRDRQDSTSPSINIIESRAIVKPSKGRCSPPVIAFDVDADRVECPSKIPMSIPALFRMDLIQREIEHGLTGRCNGVFER
jgi:hypothetical protein